MTRRSAAAPASHQASPGRVLPAAFYARPTLEVAADLPGKLLVHRSPAGETSGIIVEVEAYIGEDDPACHAAPGPTRRNRPLYGPPGRAYVYLNYGIHALLNAVTEEEGSPAAILIRALEPIGGVPLMRRRRRRAGKGVRALAPDAPDLDLCRGPGNLTRAMGISLDDNEADLTGRRLCIVDGPAPSGEVIWSPRIGIRVGTERLWRCYVAGSRAVSGGR
ncbi:MAG: DNA-3-methyladenine glycosylase [Acidobacteriota bacterium]|nr:DNA-3-methyladenine glycosylase [Acidobacteriota bacterium]